MRPRARIRRVGPRLLGATVGAAALFFAAAPAAALPWTQVTPVAAGPNPQVELNSYCEEPGEIGHLADGTTVYCSAVQGSDAFAWSYYSEPLAMGPDRDYTCDEASCEYEDGTTVPEEHRCGVQCGEPPLTGETEPHFAPGF